MKDFFHATFAKCNAQRGGQGRKFSLLDYLEWDKSGYENLNGERIQDGEKIIYFRVGNRRTSG